MSRRDRGVATPVEMLFLLVGSLLAVLFIGFLGRLHAAGVEVTNLARSASRAASLELDASSAERAAHDIVATSPLAARCVGAPRVTMAWTPSSAGTWQGGSVTVTVSCSVPVQSLTGLWAPGERSVVMSDTQPVDRYHR